MGFGRPSAISAQRHSRSTIQLSFDLWASDNKRRSVGAPRDFLRRYSPIDLPAGRIPGHLLADCGTGIGFPGFHQSCLNFGNTVAGAQFTYCDSSLWCAQTAPKQNIDASPIADDPIRARPDRPAPGGKAKFKNPNFFRPQPIDIPRFGQIRIWNNLVTPKVSAIGRGRQ